MDYTEIYNCIKKMLHAQGIEESFLERHETLYYDESGNIKHLIVKGEFLNADVDSVLPCGVQETAHKQQSVYAAADT